MNFDRLVKNILNEASFTPRVGTSGKILAQEPHERKEKYKEGEDFTAFENAKKRVSNELNIFKSLRSNKKTKEKDLYDIILKLTDSLDFVRKFKKNEDVTIDNKLTIGEISKYVAKFIDEGLQKKLLTDTHLTHWKRPADRLHSILVSLGYASEATPITKSKELELTVGQSRKGDYYYSLDKTSTPKTWVLFGKQKSSDRPVLPKYVKVDEDSLTPPQLGLYDYSNTSKNNGPLLFIDGKPTYTIRKDEEGKTFARPYTVFELEKITKNKEAFPEDWKKLPQNWRNQLKQWSVPFLKGITLDEFKNRVGSDIIDQNLGKISHPFTPIEEMEDIQPLKAKLDVERVKKERTYERPSEAKARAAERAAAREAFFNQK